MPIRQQIIIDTHDALGHPGRDKTREAMETIWWWPGMRQMITEAIKRCPTCQPDKVKPPPVEEYHVAFRPN